jgi:uncharacterized protein
LYCSILLQMSKSPIVSRVLTPIVAKALKHFPFISITGPRQSGKTTLTHLVANDWVYLNMEIDKYKNFAVKDPEGFLEKYNFKIVLDEIQCVPTLFPYLMAHTDVQNKNGAYILSGSQNFQLMDSISQSLAGRIAIFSLMPFSFVEVFPYLKKAQVKLSRIILRGFYPRLFVSKDLTNTMFYKSYIETFVKKDIKKLANIQNSRMFNTFLKLLANRAGNLLNANEVASQVGVDGTTIKRWLGLLETSYIIYQLPSYHNNLDKRILKKSKIYFHDTGVLCYLLNIKTEENLIDHSLYGSIFENFIINEKIKKYFNIGEEANAYYWQDTNGKEVDLILEHSNKLDVFEIKSSKTPKSDFLANIKLFSELAAKQSIKTNLHLIYGGEESYTQNGIKITGWLEAIL